MPDTETGLQHAWSTCALAGPLGNGKVRMDAAKIMTHPTTSAHAVETGVQTSLVGLV